MATRPYQFFINPFLVVTADSYKLMFLIGEDHFARLTGLNADPDVAAILLTYAPVWNAYKGADQNLESALGTYKGKTQTVEELMAKVIHEMLPEWEGKIRGVYYEGTPAETAFFPQKRKPFESGTYEQRISAIKVLGDKCALDASAVVVAASVGILAFHAQIEGARLMQQSQGEALVANLRTLRETSRVLLCQELYGNMGLLMHKHRVNPTDVEQYFQMEYLRSHAEDMEEVDIHEGEVLNINDDIQPGEVIGKKVKNISKDNAVVGIYFANSVSEPPQPGYAVVELQQGVQTELDETKLGPPKGFLNVINMSDAHKATMQINDDLIKD